MVSDIDIRVDYGLVVERALASEIVCIPVKRCSHSSTLNAVEESQRFVWLSELVAFALITLHLDSTIHQTLT